MPINPQTALSAAPQIEHISWNASDVMLYHLAVGAGADPMDDRELRYVTEHGSIVLPSFAFVAPMLGDATPPELRYPGVDIDLSTILHGSQRIETHRPIPRQGTATIQTGVAALHDKNSAAVVVDSVAEADGLPLWTSSMRIFVRGEGGFGGDRGPAGLPAPPLRRPDLVAETSTLPQQALLYRLLGDRNPLHWDPEVARAAGFPRPILHGMCSYGIVCRTVLDQIADNQEWIGSIEVRFTGPVFPGESLRIEMWQETDGFLFTASVQEREGSPALAGQLVTHR